LTNHKGEGLFDFPCSPAFRELERRQMIDDGLISPYPERVQEYPIRVHPIIEHTREYEQMKAHILYLDKKLNTHLSKFKGKGKQYIYK